MNTTPVIEFLEQRLCLSGTVLAAGQTAVFDFNGDGRPDGVLVNTGSVAFSYSVTGGNGLAISLLANGASLATNTWVNVAEGTPTANYGLASANVGQSLVQGGRFYNSITGVSTVTAESIGTFTDWQGDVGNITTLAGNLGTLKISNGNLDGGLIIGSASTINVSGNILGSITVANNIGSLTFNNLYGNAADLIVTAGGNIGTITANTISGGTAAGDQLGLYAGNGLGQLTANQMTGGTNSSLDFAVKGGISTLNIGTLDGGTATAGNHSQAAISVDGNLGKLIANQIIGGHGTGQAQLVVSIDQYLDSTGTLQLGDLGNLQANTISGGDTGGQLNTFDLYVYHDLSTACIGQVLGSGGGTLTGGSTSGCGNGSGYQGGSCSGSNGYSGGGYSGYQGGSCSGYSGGYSGYQGGSCSGSNGYSGGGYSGYQGGSCSGYSGGYSGYPGGSCSGSNGYSGGGYSGYQGGSCSGSNSYSGGQGGSCTGSQGSRGSATCDPAVNIDVGHNILNFAANQITGGTATAGELSYMAIVAGNDIVKFSANSIVGGSASGAGSLSYMQVDAGHDIDQFSASSVAGGTTSNGGRAYVDLLGEHNIVNMNLGAVTAGANNAAGQTSAPSVQIHAYNAIQNFSATSMTAVNGGAIDLLAGVGPGGVISGDPNSLGVAQPASLGQVTIGAISAASNGDITIGASGNLSLLNASSVSATGGGQVDVIAGQNMTLQIAYVQAQPQHGGSGPGAAFTSGGSITNAFGSHVPGSLENSQTIGLVLPTPLNQPTS